MPLKVGFISGSWSFVSLSHAPFRVFVCGVMSYDFNTDGWIQDVGSSPIRAEWLEFIWYLLKTIPEFSSGQLCGG